MSEGDRSRVRAVLRARGQVAPHRRLQGGLLGEALPKARGSPGLAERTSVQWGLVVGRAAAGSGHRGAGLWKEQQGARVAWAEGPLES